MICLKQIFLLLMSLILDFIFHINFFPSKTIFSPKMFRLTRCKGVLKFIIWSKIMILFMIFYFIFKWNFCNSHRLSTTNLQHNSDYFVKLSFAHGFRYVILPAVLVVYTSLYLEIYILLPFLAT